MMDRLDPTLNVKCDGPLIINSPKLQSFPQVITTRTLTLFFWGLWAYMWLPLTSLVLWLFGIHMFESRILVEDGWHSLISVFPKYLLALDVLVGGLILWACVNIWRFSGPERRVHREPTKISEQAKFCGTDPSKLCEWQHSRRLVIYYTETAGIDKVEMS